MTLQEIYKKEVEKRLPLKTFKVKSKTNFNPDLGEFETYSVEQWANNEWTCSCMGFRGHKKPCKHIKEQQLKL